jgi:hypothetical protein
LHELAPDVLILFIDTLSYIDDAPNAFIVSNLVIQLLIREHPDTSTITLFAFNLLTVETMRW